MTLSMPPRSPEALKARHADTLGDRLLALGHLERDICISISLASAETRAGQHLLVHLANLLGRLEGVVRKISVVIDDEGRGDSDKSGQIMLDPGVDPRHPMGGLPLRLSAESASDLAAPGRAVSISELASDAIHVRIGAEGTTPAYVYTAAGGWSAFVGRRPGPECIPDVTLAVGAHIAAALATAEVFRIIRATGNRANGPDCFTFSAWCCSPVDSLSHGDCLAPSVAATSELSTPSFVLAGVGAVGGAFLLTYWASGLRVPRSAVVDGDVISSTNLGRYALFGVDELGLPKASRAAILLGAGPQQFRLVPVEAWWGDYQRIDPTPIPLLISAVDTNIARHQLQDALPGIILGASTHVLRAEVARYDLADPLSRCLKCFNMPEASEDDLRLQRRLLAMDIAALAREAEDRAVPLKQLEKYVADLSRGGTGCAILAGPALDKLRHREGEGAFAVSFVSSLAGSLLAAQVIREAMDVPLLTAPSARAILQLWVPDALSNGCKPSAPDPACWCSSPSIRAVHASLWRAAP
jgi:hypothetical protein